MHACEWCNVYCRFRTRYFTREIKLWCFPVIYFAPSLQTSIPSSRDSPFSLRWVNQVKNILPASPSLQRLAKQQFNFNRVIICVPGDSKKTAVPAASVMSSSCNAEFWLLFVRSVTSSSVSVLISWIRLETVLFESGTVFIKLPNFSPIKVSTTSIMHCFIRMSAIVGFSSPIYLVTHVN